MKLAKFIFSYCAFGGNGSHEKLNLDSLSIHTSGSCRRPDYNQETMGMSSRVQQIQISRLSCSYLRLKIAAGLHQMNISNPVATQLLKKTAQEKLYQSLEFV